MSDITHDDGAVSLRPQPRQVRWQECEVGVIYHFDMQTYMPAEFGQNTYFQTRETPPIELINPTKLDTDQWLEAARDMGARYAVFTATHFSGFMSWQSELYPYGLTYSPWRNGKADIVGDFVESCRRYDILPGLYLSTCHNVYHTAWNHYVNWGEGCGTEAQAAYNRVCEAMVTELVTRYGPLLQIWFDAGVKTPELGGPDVLPICRKHQPEMVFYHSPACAEHRWIGNESGLAGDPCWATVTDTESQSQAHRNKKDMLFHGDPDGAAWSPGMCDVPLRNHDWLWRPNGVERIETLDSLLNMYYQSVGRNANLLVGITPDKDGLVPEPDVARMKELGDEVRRRFGSPVATTSGVGEHVELSLPCATRIDHVSIGEYIQLGERVRRYEVDVICPDGTERRVAEGRSIGHRRIHRFEPVEAAALRLSVTGSIASPRISRFGCYATG